MMPNGAPQQWQPMPYPAPSFGRPGVTTAAAVLGFVQAGLAIIGGLVLVVSYTAVDAEDRADDAGLVLFATVPQFALCGVLIYAAVRLLRGQSLRLFDACHAGILVLSLFYFLIFVERMSELPEDISRRAADDVSSSFVLPVVFAALAIVTLCLAGGQATRSFCGRSRGDRRPEAA